MRHISNMKLAAFATLIALAIAQRQFDGPAMVRIVNGFDASQGQFPYVVSLRSSKDRGHFCGGAIINSRWIGTAAHCSESETVDDVYIFAGSHDLQSDGLIYNISKIVNHPGYDDIDTKMDISLLRTSEPIEFNEFVQPISLPMEDIAADTPVIIAGWGSTSLTGSFKHISSKLQFLVQRVVMADACKQSFDIKYPSYAKRDFTTLLCAQTMNAATCTCDSGLYSNNFFSGGFKRIILKNF